MRRAGVIGSGILLVLAVASPGTVRAGAAADSIRSAISAERFADAARGARALIAEIESRAPLDSLALGEAWDLRVEALWRGGQAVSPEADEAVERARVLRERTARVPALVLANSLHQRANLLKAAGRYDGVRPLYEQAIAIRLATLGPSHADVARALNDYGNLMLYAGAYAEAESLYLRSCAAYESLGAAQRRNLGKCLNNLGVLRQTAGDYGGARIALERARQLFEAAMGPAHYNVATAEVNLASLLVRTGDREEALARLERAHRLYVGAEGPEHPDVAWARRVQGEAYMSGGDLAHARSALEEAAAIHEKSLGPAHPELALDLATLARVEMAAGHDSAAEADLRRALAIHEKALGPNHAFVAQDLEGLGKLAAKRGDVNDALTKLNRSLAIREQALGADHPEVAASLIALAATQWARGARDSAVALALRAEQVAREHLRLTLRTLPERQALTVARERVRGLDLALSIPNVSGTGGELADAIVRSRSVVLEEMIRRGHRVRVEPGMEELAAKLLAARTRLARVTVKGPGSDPPERYRRLREEAVHDREQAERDLAQASLRFRERSRERNAGLSEVMAALPADAALVNYVLYDRSPDSTEWLARTTPVSPSSGLREPAGKSRSSYFALVLTPGSEPALIPLGDAAAIDTATVRWRRETMRVQLEPQWRWKAAETDCRRSGETVRRAVWDPLEKHLSGARRVFIVADGALELVPFAALPESGKYLLESGPTFHVLTSARNLVAARDSVHATRVLLAVGNPDYDAGAVSTASPARPCAAGLPVFRPLPGSGAEASWVTGFWKTAGNPASPDSATSLIGRAATERAVRRDAPRAQVLHFATHGFVSVGSCAAPARDEIDRAAFGGLALAGANGHGAKSGADDGILTGEEIAGLDLDATDLAVLSACNSGAGEVLRGEGVAGLRRAFEEAGCRGLVMSLWPVQDESTQSWMRSLYRARFEKGLATDEAVRAASRALLDQRRKEGASTHPFAWAAFVAAGDWR